MAAYGGLPLQWEAPGEGYWEYDPIHFPRPVPRAAQAALVHGLSGGLAAGFGWVGQPLVTMDVAYVNDVMYSRMRRWRREPAHGHRVDREPHGALEGRRRQVVSGDAAGPNGAQRRAASVRAVEDVRRGAWGPPRRARDECR